MRRLLLALALYLVVQPWNSLSAQDASLDLILQVQRMQQWLGASPHADGWRRFLLLNQLESQTVKAWRGDPVVVQTILSRFEASQPGLEHAVFEGVRQALRQHSQQLSLASADLEAAFASARENFVPATMQRTQAEFSRLQTEVAVCRNRYMTTLPSADAARAIADLRFDELDKIVSAIDLTPPATGAAASRKQADDLRSLRTIVLSYGEQTIRHRDRFLPVVRRQLERAFFQYSQLLQANPQGEFEGHLTKLRNLLPKLSDPSQRGGQGEFAQELGWLDATGHAPRLVAAIRTRYSLPNVEFRVAESFARAAATRPVHSHQPVDEVILGRQIYGQAVLNGRVEFDFVDDPDQAHVSLQLFGRTNSDTHTSQGPITAYAGSTADVEVRRSILANVGGITEYAPYCAANLSSEFRGVDCIPLVERLAYKQYLRDKDASEAIGARRMERRVLNQFEQQSGDTIRQAKERMRKRMSDTEAPLGFVPALAVRTTHDQLLGMGLKADTFQVSAPTAPPAVVVVPADVVLQVHESMLDNIVEPVLARQTIKSNQFGEKFKQWFGKLPEGFQEPSGDELWGITFAASRPVQFIFDGNRFGVAIAGSRFTRDEEYRDPNNEKKTRVKETIDEPMMIKVTFRLQRDAGQVILVREGRATVEFTRPGVQTVPKNAFRSFLEDLLNKSLREQDAKQAADGGTGGPSNLKLPANLIPTDRLPDPTIPQNLELVVFRSEGGWVTAAWRHALPTAGTYGSPGARVVGPVDVPAIVDFVVPPAPAQ
jgi:hypothetical protein